MQHVVGIGLLFLYFVVWDPVPLVAGLIFAGVGIWLLKIGFGAPEQVPLYRTLTRDPQNIQPK